MRSKKIYFLKKFIIYMCLLHLQCWWHCAYFLHNIILVSTHKSKKNISLNHVILLSFVMVTFWIINLLILVFYFEKKKSKWPYPFIYHLWNVPNQLQFMKLFYLYYYSKNILNCTTMIYWSILTMVKVKMMRILWFVFLMN